LKQKWEIRRLCVRALFAWLISLTASLAAATTEVQTSCKGNIETANRKIVHPGVSYFLWYSISGTAAKVRFVGRELDASVETGSSWQGRWLKRVDDAVYFSFFPDEGGTIKFQFELDRWFIGNCVLSQSRMEQNN
jgi:hypothetical protein